MDVVATYSDILGVNGAAPVGDLYTSLEIDFVNGSFVSNTMQFRADTDNAEGAGGDITPVPEPSSLTILALGLLSVMALVRRKK